MDKYEMLWKSKFFICPLCRAGVGDLCRDGRGIPMEEASHLVREDKVIAHEAMGGGYTLTTEGAVTT